MFFLHMDLVMSAKYVNEHEFQLCYLCDNSATWKSERAQKYIARAMCDPRFLKGNSIKVSKNKASIS